jgi:hypothetical protein
VMLVLFRSRLLRLGGGDAVQRSSRR